MRQLILILGLVVFCQPVHAAEQSTATTKLTAVPQILGGYQAASGAWPWMTALLRSSVSDVYNAQYCGGALIAADWVLTAGHCVEDMSAGDIEVAVGAYDLSTWSGTRIGVKRIVRHPSYVDFHANDIALLELDSSSSQTPVAIFSGASDQGIDAKLLGQMTTLVGWGLADTATTWYYPEILRQVNLPVVADAYCSNGFRETLTGSQICAGYAVAKDACGGDSGGPLMLAVDGEWVHVGLVSYGANCEVQNGFYGVYTRSSAYMDFIQQYVPNARFTAVTPPTQPLPWLMLLLHSTP